MPIGNVHKSSENIGVALDYDLSEGRFKNQKEDKKPTIVLAYKLLLGNSKHIKLQLKEQARENPKVKNKALRFSINFPPDDRTPEDTRIKFVANVMRELGIDENNHQALVTRHYDKHPHYHILVNRIGFDGKTLSDSHTKRRLELSIDKWEKVMLLDNSLAVTRKYVYDKTSEKGYKTQKRADLRQNKPLPKQKETKKDFVQQSVLEALNNNKIESPEELAKILLKKGIEFQFTKNKNGLAGTSFKYQNQAFKGSVIGFKASVLKGIFGKNEQQRLEEIKAQEEAERKAREEQKNAEKTKPKKKPKIDDYAKIMARNNPPAPAPEPKQEPKSVQEQPKPAPEPKQEPKSAQEQPKPAPEPRPKNTIEDINNAFIGCNEKYLKSLSSIRYNEKEIRSKYFEFLDGNYSDLKLKNGYNFMLLISQIKVFRQSNKSEQQQSQVQQNKVNKGLKR